MLRWNEADERSELPRIGEAREVAEFGDDRDGHEPLHAAHWMYNAVVDDDGEVDMFLADARKGPVGPDAWRHRGPLTRAPRVR